MVEDFAVMRIDLFDTGEEDHQHEQKTPVAKVVRAPPLHPLAFLLLVRIR
jgi:hypothetical protein